MEDIKKSEVPTDYSSYGKRDWKKLMIIYIIIGVIVYAGIYYFFLSKKTSLYPSIYPTPTVSNAIFQTPTDSTGAANSKTEALTTGKIVISKDKGIALIDPDGKNLKELVSFSMKNLDNEEVSDLAWSPDGKQIVYITADYSPYIDTERDKYMISVIDVTSGIITTIIDNAGYISNPSWSPDGKDIIYNADGTLKIVNVTSKTSKDVVSNAYSEIVRGQNDIVAGHRPWRVIWTKSGKVVYFEKVDSDPSSSKKILVISNIDGSNKKTLITDPTIDYGDFALSPDGNWFALFIGNTTKDFPTQGVWLLATDGNSKKLLADEQIVNGGLLWSPDSKSLITMKGVQDVYEITINSGNVIKLPFLGSVGSVSPDGTKILYLQYKSGNPADGSQIMIYDRQSKKSKKLSDVIGLRWTATWSPK